MFVDRNISQEEFEELIKDYKGDELYICHSENITSIPTLENLKVLDCSDCLLLTSIPSMPNLKYLNISGTHGIKIIPMLLQLESIDFDGVDISIICDIPNITEYIGEDSDNKQLIDEIKLKNEYIKKIKIVAPHIVKFYKGYERFADVVINKLISLC